MLSDHLLIDDEVASALDDGRPVVALESTLISHGLRYPINLEVARAAQTAARERGAVPATIAIRDGRLRVGLTDGDLEQLATAAPGTVAKAARPTLAAALSRPGWASTTVSATMIVAEAAGIRVFATGGIGGVHRGAVGGTADMPTLDISSDLEELARTPVVVVCAGPKAILDVRATIEYLETRGVPVVTIGQDEVPGFWAQRSGVDAPLLAGSVADAAEIARWHFDLGLGSGLLVCVPVPESRAIGEDVARAATEQAYADAATAGVRGPALTPFLLARIAELTDGASVDANTSLIVNNARFAADLTAAIAGA